MTHRSPLVTLAGLVVAFAVMFGVNLASSAPRATGYPAPSPTAVAQNTAPTPSPPTTPAPSTPAPSPSAPGPSTATPSRSFPDRVVYAGRTRNDSASVAVAVLGDRAAAYFCDGRSVEAWLRGTVKDDELTLKSRDGAKLEARLTGKRLSGRIEIDDDELEFTLAVAERPAGLYRARGSKTTIGWIVLPDGSQVGIQNSGGRIQAAPDLDPDSPQVEVDGRPLEASPVSGDEDL